MNEKFQQAVVASRAGQDKAAQYLLAESLQEDPNDPNAWFLLSQLVDSEEKQQTYLKKTLMLDPDHELANEYYAAASAAESDDMAALEAALDAPLEDIPLALDGAEEDMDDWLAAAVEADSDPSVTVDEIDFAGLLEEDAGEEIEETAVTDPVIQIEEKAAEADEEETKVEKETAVVDAKTAKRLQEAKTLAYIIYLLMAIGIIIFFYIIYLLIA